MKFNGARKTCRKPTLCIALRNRIEKKTCNTQHQQAAAQLSQAISQSVSATAAAATESATAVECCSLPLYCIMNARVRAFHFDKNARKKSTSNSQRQTSEVLH